MDELKIQVKQTLALTTVGACLLLGIVGVFYLMLNLGDLILPCLAYC